MILQQQAQLLGSGVRLTSVSSQDSGFTSQDTLFLRPTTPSSLNLNTQVILSCTSCHDYCRLLQCSHGFCPLQCCYCFCSLQCCHGYCRLLLYSHGFCSLHCCHSYCHLLLCTVSHGFCRLLCVCHNLPLMSKS